MDEVLFALNLPGGFGEITPPPGIPTGNLQQGEKILQTGITLFLIFIVFLSIYYIIWGAFRYIIAKGDREKIHAARERITYAIVGLVVAFFSFLVVGTAGQFFNVNLIAIAPACTASGGVCIPTFPCDPGYEPSSLSCGGGEVCCVPIPTSTPTPIPSCADFTSCASCLAAVLPDGTLCRWGDPGLPGVPPYCQSGLTTCPAGYVAWYNVSCIQNECASPTSTPTPTPTSTPGPTSTPTPTPTSTPTPFSCSDPGESCGAGIGDCCPGLVCTGSPPKCAFPTSTPVPTSTPTPTPTTGPTPTPTLTVTPCTLSDSDGLGYDETCSDGTGTYKDYCSGGNVHFYTCNASTQLCEDNTGLNCVALGMFCIVKPDGKSTCTERKNTVNGNVWNDANEDGELDAWSGYIGAKVDALSDGSVVATTTSSGSTGYFELIGLDPGGYTIVLTMPSGYRMSSGSNGGNNTVTLTVPPPTNVYNIYKAFGIVPL